MFATASRIRPWSFRSIPIIALENAELIPRYHGGGRRVGAGGTRGTAGINIGAPQLSLDSSMLGAITGGGSQTSRSWTKNGESARCATLPSLNSAKLD